MDKLFLIEEEYEDKIITLMQFCKKGGQLLHGFDSSIQSIRNHKSKLIIIASDIAENSLNKIIKELQKTKIIAIMLSTKSNISSRFNIRDVGIFSVLDKNIFKGIIKFVNFDLIENSKLGVKK